MVASLSARAGQALCRRTEHSLWGTVGRRWAARVVPTAGEHDTFRRNTLTGSGLRHAARVSYSRNGPLSHALEPWARTTGRWFRHQVQRPGPDSVKAAHSRGCALPSAVGFTGVSSVPGTSTNLPRKPAASSGIFSGWR